MIFFSSNQKATGLLVLGICLAAVTLCCLWITVGLGFSPSDDALRHVAKVLSGKAWQDILVVRDAYSMDSHPGWHFLLEGFVRLVGPDREALLIISVCFLFILFACTPLFLLRRPEAWVLALLIFTVFTWGPIFRLFYGRPYIFSMFLVLLFCFLWERIRDRDRPYLELLVFTFIVSLATWIHGAWYLLTLPLAALALARQWRVFALMAAATAVGVMLGALFTGSPLTFLRQMAYHALQAMGTADLQQQLVTEFWSFVGEPSTVKVVALLLLWRGVRGQWRSSCIDNPVFLLALLGWGLGFFAGRFWLDWGWPALAFWTARELQGVLQSWVRDHDPRRIALALAACLVFTLALANDRGGRWTSRGGEEWPVLTEIEHQPWLPDPGGIVYSTQMHVFYQLFFHNPHAQWRYILGFEPAWMPEEDLRIFRNIQLGQGRTLAPWLERMTARDRFIAAGQRPNIEGLEWKEVTPGVWIGKFDCSRFE